MIEALNNGELLALASDQNAGIKGMRIPFFGKELSIPKGAAYFYHKTNIFCGDISKIGAQRRIIPRL